MSSNSLKILESLQEKNINMRHFLLLPTTIFFFLVKAKKKERRTYIVSLKLKRSFILMKDEQGFADFTSTRVLIFLSGGFIHTICA